MPASWALNELPCEARGDLVHQLGIGRHRDRRGRTGSGLASVPFGRAERDRVDRDLVARPPGVATRDRVLRRRWRRRRRAARSRRGPLLVRLVEHAESDVESASPVAVAAVGDLRVDRVAGGGVVGGRRQDRRRASSRSATTPTRDRGRQLIDERVRGALGRGEPRRRHVVGGHRARVVEHEHERRLPRSPPSGARCGRAERDRERGDREQQRRRPARCRRQPGAAPRPRPAASHAPGSAARSVARAAARARCASSAAGISSSASSHSGELKLIRRPRASALAQTRVRARPASRCRCRARRARRRSARTRPRAHRGARARAPRSARAGAATRCRPRPARRVSGSTRARRPSAGSLRLARVVRSRPRARRGGRAARRAGAPSRAGRGSRRRSRPRLGPPREPRARAERRRRARSASLCAVRGHAGGEQIAAPPTSPGRAPRGGSTIGAPAPNATTPTLPARRTASRASTSATPSATSAFSRSRGAERHRRRDVEHDPGRQRPLGHVQPHVRLPGPRGRGGVEVAHVVAGLVGAQLRQLGADADAGGAAVAGQAARDQPHERDVDARRRSARGIGPGPLTARRRLRGRRLAIARGATRVRRSLVGLGDRDQQPLDHVVGREPVAERLIGEHDAGGAARRRRGRGRRRRSRGRVRAAAPAPAPPATRPIGPRGLAPNSISASRSREPVTARDGGVASASATA